MCPYGPLVENYGREKPKYRRQISVVQQKSGSNPGFRDKWQASNHLRKSMAWKLKLIKNSTLNYSSHLTLNIQDSRKKKKKKKNQAANAI